MKKLTFITAFVLVSLISIAQSKSDTSQTIVKETATSIQTKAVLISETQEFKETKEITIDLIKSGAKATLKGVGSVSSWLYYEGGDALKEGWEDGKKED